MKKKNYTKTHKYNTCTIHITNSSNLISNEKAFYFCKEYIEYYLSIEGGYIPIEVKNSATIYVELVNDKSIFKVLVDGNIHFKMNIKKFHNTQSCTPEINSSYHSAFFMQIHYHRFSGIDIIEHYPF
jgi:hypothetical protein